ncbi:MAG: hypothetical protein U0871_10170 [Gemmataceae bacterium]
MNRMCKAAAVVVAAAGGLGAAGCAHTERPSAQDRYASHVDPCWPERYSYQARQAVIATQAAQHVNGAIADATVFEYFFESGSDTLLPGGRQKLDYLARKRPAPDRVIYLQTARDLAYNAAAVEKLTADRQELDAKRIQAIQKYLAATTAGRGLAFDVQVVDLPDLTYGVQGPSASVRGYPGRFQSGLGLFGMINSNIASGLGQNMTIIPVPGGMGGGAGGGGGGAGGAGGAPGAGGQ